MIVAVIPAKGDSNRLADKNLLEINNLSLIEHAIRYARGSDRVDSVYVSTDSDAIANLASELGVGAIMRGEKLGGEAPLMDDRSPIGKSPISWESSRTTRTGR